MLQEIFDESAYRRFLDRNQLQCSVNAYAVFRQENEQTRSRRPRCCWEVSKLVILSEAKDLLFQARAGRW